MEEDPVSEELTWTPAWRMRELIGTSEVSCAEVTDHFLGRIEEHNPTLRAFEQVDWDGARNRPRWPTTPSPATRRSARCTASPPRSSRTSASPAST